LKDCFYSFKMLVNLGAALALFSLATAAVADHQMSAIERKVRVSLLEAWELSVRSNWS
jgi:hypothetical protein